MSRPAWVPWWAPILEVVIWTLFALFIGVVVVTALSGCTSETRYAAARLTWSASEVTGEVVEREYRRGLCAAAGRPYSSQEMAECRVRLEQLLHAVALDAGHTRFLSLARINRVVRDTAAAAVLALWAAEEGEPPGDLRERLSCVSTALLVLVQAFDQLDLPVPVIVEQASSALLTFGPTGRRFALGECPGVDDAATGPPRGETPAPMRDAGPQAPSVSPSGAARDPFVVDGGAS